MLFILEGFNVFPIRITDHLQLTTSLSVFILEGLSVYVNFMFSHLRKHIKCCVAAHLHGPLQKVPHNLPLGKVWGNESENKMHSLCIIFMQSISNFGTQDLYMKLWNVLLATPTRQSSRNTRARPRLHCNPSLQSCQVCVCVCLCKCVCVSVV